MTRARTAVASSFLALAVIAGCAARHEPPAAAPSAKPAVAKVAPIDPVRAAYPDLAALYGGSAGIYHTCAANQGVCHNDKESPNLATLGAVVQTIRADCNVTREKPREVHDLCEKPGDSIVLGDEKIEVAGIARAPVKKGAAVPEEYGTLHLLLKSAPRTTKKVPKNARARLVRDASGPPIDLGRVELLGIRVSKTGSGIADVRVGYDEEPLRVTVPGEREEDGSWGGVSDPLALHFGDPNGNGVFGASLGGGLVVPGKPEKSYLMTRLTDPSAGPLMPRANCCSWTKASLRALYCWISGLRPDGSNALAPIDYAACPPGPREDVAYPEPGPRCETSGMCPVTARESASTGAASGDATWASVFSKVLASRCAGGACHTDAAHAVFDVRSEAAAFRSAREHVVPRAPERSELFVRISPTLCTPPACTPMPMGGTPLDAESRALVRRWIEHGAQR